MPLPSLRHNVYYVEDLRDLFRWGTLAKQKAFLGSFIKRRELITTTLPLITPSLSHVKR